MIFLHATMRPYEARCEEALGVVERWKGEIARGSYILWSPTIRCAVIAGLMSTALPAYSLVRPINWHSSARGCS
jgi:hypothetical protein